jgi:hypothetical protein
VMTRLAINLSSFNAVLLGYFKDRTILPVEMFWLTSLFTSSHNIKESEQVINIRSGTYKMDQKVHGVRKNTSLVPTLSWRIQPTLCRVIQWKLI